MSLLGCQVTRHTEAITLAAEAGRGERKGVKEGTGRTKEEDLNLVSSPLTKRYPEVCPWNTQVPTQHSVKTGDTSEGCFRKTGIGFKRQFLQDVETRETEEGTLAEYKIK